MRKQILVTGGAGYIGSHTVCELYSSGYEPILIDNFSNSEEFIIDRLEEILSYKLKFYKGDVRDLSLLNKIYKENPQITGIIHFAASKAVGESVEKPIHYYKNNLESTLTVLEFMTLNSLKNLVFSSSCTVYGEPDQLPVTELTPRKTAVSPYGNTKQICEDFIRDVVKSKARLKAISLRYFNPIGAHKSAKIGELPIGTPANLIPFITQTVAGIRDGITVFGNDYNTIDGTCIRDYIHVLDLANAHIKALEYLDNQPGDSYYDIFNAGVGKGSSVMEVISGFEKATGEQVKYKTGPRRNGDVEKIYADTQKANELLNWKAKFTLEDALLDAWNWQKTLK